ncbi:hypothetical protein [Coleofasciculus sp. B1-GNL1-01]|jgi:hypothetical protein|uniref:hypothetical protein n=1 Tax=unclassified Coleofasciculus TaxID=2692782 RepID=UPI00330426C1
MTNIDGETDEDKQIARLKIHRDLIGWIIKELRQEGILAERTVGGNPDGDILIVNQDHVPRVKEIIRQMQRRFNP